MALQELNYQTVTQTVKHWPIEQRFRLLQELLGTLAPIIETEKLNQQNEIEVEEERPAWHTIAGIAPYPMLGEDAQEWVSRTRQEGDERRETALRGIE